MQYKLKGRLCNEEKPKMVLAITDAETSSVVWGNTPMGYHVLTFWPTFSIQRDSSSVTRWPTPVLFPALSIEHLPASLCPTPLSGVTAIFSLHRLLQVSSSL